MDTTGGWFEQVDGTDPDALAEVIRSGECDRPRPWSEVAVSSGFVVDTESYYDRLHAVIMRATRDAVDQRERGDDRRIVHQVRAMDDCLRTANELAERLSEWATTVDDDPGTGIDYARSILDNAKLTDEPTIRSLAARVVDLSEEAHRLEQEVERSIPEVTPNLCALAGPILSARLLAQAGSLETLARKPSGTLQVIGAEDALFAHLQTGAPPPKHGIIYTHDAVRTAPPDARGAIARTLAGKLTIAARIDHYSGERDETFIEEAIERIRTVNRRSEQ